MSARLCRQLVVSLLLAPAALVAQGGTARVETTAFGRPALIEVLSLPEDQATEALHAAQEALATVEASFGEAPGNVRDEIVARAAQGPVKLAPLLFDLVLRAFNFCQWNQGAHGPLAAELYRLWGIPEPAAALPTPRQLRRATALARCDRLRLDPVERTVALAEGSELQLWGFATGYAVDRGVEALRARGAGNGRIVVGRIERAFGLGPQGSGWPVDLPGYTSFDGRPLRIYLRDASVAVASWEDRPLEIAGEVHPPYLDQRTGRPAERMVATAVVSELAIDAQGLSVALFVMGSHEGQMRLGSIRPAPSVLWVEGSRDGEPLLVQYRWHLVPRH